MRILIAFLLMVGVAFADLEEDLDIYLDNDVVIYDTHSYEYRNNYRGYPLIEPFDYYYPHDWFGVYDPPTGLYRRPVLED